MSTYVDCPHCGTEFSVSDDIVSSSLRCPDCLQWINTFEEYSGTMAAYASYSTGSLYEDYGYQEGYDY